MKNNFLNKLLIVAAVFFTSSCNKDFLTYAGLWKHKNNKKKVIFYYSHITVNFYYFLIYL